MNGSMPAVRWHGRRDVRVEQVPVPVPRPHQALIQVDWCGICGTDLEEYLSGPVYLTGAPLTLGHEIVGTVVEAAADGTGAQVGTRVVPDTIVGCGTCFWCSQNEVGLCPDISILGLHENGGLARYVVANAATSVPLPDQLPSDVAALAEPTSVAVRAVRRAPIAPDSTALVIGAGTIGLLVVQVARAYGAERVLVIDPVDERRDLALQLGATTALRPEDADESLLDLSQGRGPDVVFECSGVPGQLGGAIRQTRAGGTCVLVGFHGKPEQFDVLDLVLGEKRVMGSAAHLWDLDVARAVDLLASGKVAGEPLLSHRIGLGDVVAGGLERLADRDSGALKIVVSPEL